MPVDNPLRTNALELLYILQANLQANTPPIPAGDDEDRELVMAIAPLFQQHLEAAQQQGRVEGREEGREEGRKEGRKELQRMILESFLQVRFGELDPRTIALILPISALPVAEFTLLLVQLSTLPAGENQHQQVQYLLAETVLNKYFARTEQSSEFSASIIPNLLALSPDNLSSLLAELPQLSIEELMARLGQSLT